MSFNSKDGKMDDLLSYGKDIVWELAKEFIRLALFLSAS